MFTSKIPRMVLSLAVILAGFQAFAGESSDNQAPIFDRNVVTKVSSSGAFSTFISKAKWYAYSGPISNLESHGIIMDAVMRGHRVCASTYQYCTIKNVSLDFIEQIDGIWYTQYEVVLMGYGAGAVVLPTEIFEKTASVNSTVNTNSLIPLSAEYIALARAFEACYAKGFATCAIVGYNLNEANSPINGRYQTSAVATVIGIN